MCIRDRNKDYVKRLQDAEERSIDQATEEQYLELLRTMAVEERTIKEIVQISLAHGKAYGDILHDIKTPMAGKNLNSCIKLNHYRESHSLQ